MFLLCTFLFLYSCSLVFFGGRISHHSLVLPFSVNIFLCRFRYKKKKYKVFAQMADACRRMNYVDKVKVTSVMLFKDVVMKQGVVNAFQSILSKLGY